MKIRTKLISFIAVLLLCCAGNTVFSQAPMTPERIDYRIVNLKYNANTNLITFDVELKQGTAYIPSKNIGVADLMFTFNLGSNVRVDLDPTPTNPTKPKASLNAATGFNATLMRSEPPRIPYFADSASMVEISRPPSSTIPYPTSSWIRVITMSYWVTTTEKPSACSFVSMREYDYFFGSQWSPYDEAWPRAFEPADDCGGGKYFILPDDIMVCDGEIPNLMGSCATSGVALNWRVKEVSNIKDLSDSPTFVDSQPIGGTDPLELSDPTLAGYVIYEAYYDDCIGARVDIRVDVNPIPDLAITKTCDALTGNFVASMTITSDTVNRLFTLNNVDFLTKSQFEDQSFGGPNYTVTVVDTLTGCSNSLIVGCSFCPTLNLIGDASLCYRGTGNHHISGSYTLADSVVITIQGATNPLGLSQNLSKRIDDGGLINIYYTPISTDIGQTIKVIFTIPAWSTCDPVVDTFTFTVYDLPTVDVHTKVVTRCSDVMETFTFAGSGWATPVDGDSVEYSRTDDFATLISSVDVNSGDSALVYVRAFYSLSGCAGDAIDSIKFKVYGLPTLTVPNHLISGCSDDPVTFNFAGLATTSNGDSVEYCLSKGFTTLISSVIVNSEDSATVYVRAYNSVTECAGTIDSIKFKVYELPTVNIPVTNRLITSCSDAAETFNFAGLATPTGGDSLQYSYTKVFAAPFPSSVSVNPGDSATVYVRAINTVTGCIGTAIDSIKFKVYGFPTVNIPVANKLVTRCSDDPETFNFAGLATPTGGDSLQYSYTKVFAAPYPSSVSVNPGDSATVYVRAINTVTGCIGTAIDSIEFKVYEYPIVVDVTDLVTRCSDETETFTFTGLAFPLGGDSLQYSLTKAFIAPYLSSVSVNPGDSATVYVRAINTVTGCIGIAIDSIKFKVFRLPTVNIPVANKLVTRCSDVTETFNFAGLATPTYGDSLQYSYTKVFAAPFPSSVTVSVGDSATVYVRAINTVTGCIGTAIDSIKFKVYGLPTVTVVSSLNTTCSSTAVVYLFDGLATPTGGDLLQYSLTKAFIAPYLSSVSVNPGDSATVYVRAYNSVTECAGDAIDSIKFKVYPNPILSVRDTTVCSTNPSENFNLTILASSSGDIVEYNTSSSFSPGTIVTTPTAHTVYTGTEKIFIRATYTATGCFTIDSLTITVGTIPDVYVTLLTGDTTVCSVKPFETFNLTTLARTTTSGAIVQFNTSSTFAAGTMITATTAYQVSTGSTVTIFVRGYNPVTRCVTPIADIKSFTIIIERCGLFDCSAILNPVVDVRAPGDCQFTNVGDIWDVVPVAPVVDSIHYFINGVAATPDISTLNGVTFPVGISNVKVIAWFEDIIDSCEFTVTVNTICPTITYPDGSGYTYAVTNVAGICWTTNLRATEYEGGGNITFAKPYYSTLYPDIAAHDTIFGLLYTWYSAVGVTEGSNETPLQDAQGFVQGICPPDFHIPSQEEFNKLRIFTSEELKSKNYWLVPGNNASKFDARPAGQYNGALDRFENLYGFTGYWSNASVSAVEAQYFYLTYYCDYLLEGQLLKTDGLSVRCVWNGCQK